MNNENSKAVIWLAQNHKRMDACIAATCQSLGVQYDEWDNIKQAYKIHFLTKIAPRCPEARWDRVTFAKKTRLRFVIDHLRRKQNGRCGSIPLDDAPHPVASADEIEEAATLALLIRRLPELYRETLQAWLRTGVATEAAVQLGISLDAFRKRMSRAEDALYRMVHGEEHGLEALEETPTEERDE